MSWKMSHLLAVLLPVIAPATYGGAPVVFGVIGDFGSGSATETAVANVVKSWNPGFIITTGDDNYPVGGADTIDTNIGRDYHEFIYNYNGRYGPGSPTRRFFPVPGNHDYFTENAQPYYDFFDLPGNERYYKFSQGPADFFMLNSNDEEPDGVDAGSKQASWLREAMAGSPVRWKVVTMHHAPYSSGAVHGNSMWMQWPYARWGASVVLAGHDHTYERLSIDGIPYFVNGIGGSSRYNFDSPPLPESQVRFNSSFGAMRGIASDMSMSFEFLTTTLTQGDSFTVAPPVSKWGSASGRWDDATKWSNSPIDRADITLESSAGVFHTVDYYATDGADMRLGRLAIDATGAGQMLLSQQQHALRVGSMVVGGESRAGVFRKTGGSLDVDTIYNAGTFEHLGGTLHLVNAFYNAAGMAELGGSLQFDPCAWIIAAGGTLRITSDAGAVSRPSLKIRDTATVELGGIQHLESLEMTGGRAFINGNGIVVANLLSIGPGAQFDIGLGGMVLFYSGSSPSGALEQMVQAGLLTAGSAGTGRTVAIIDNIMFQQASWRGEPLFASSGDFNQVMAISALCGDTNLDGVVDNQDFMNIIAHQGRPGTWIDGDVNHDGMVTVDDNAIVAAHLGNNSAQQRSANTVVVPEPSISVLLAMLPVTLLRPARTPRPHTSRPTRRSGRSASECTSVLLP